jgi:hypothetical protein
VRLTEQAELFQGFFIPLFFLLGFALTSTIVLALAMSFRFAFILLLFFIG